MSYEAYYIWNRETGQSRTVAGFESELDAHIFLIQSIDMQYQGDWKPGNCDLRVYDKDSRESIMWRTLNYLAECQNNGAQYPSYFWRSYGKVNEGKLGEVTETIVKPAGYFDHELVPMLERAYSALNELEATEYEPPFPLTAPVSVEGTHD